MKRLISNTSTLAGLTALFFATLLPIVIFTISSPLARAQGFSSDEPRGQYRTQNTYCRELERELASDWVRGNSSNNRLPELKKNIRKQDRLFNKLQNKADRMDCYENMFIFGRSLRRTKKCHAIDRKIRKAKKKLMDLRDQRAQIKDSRQTGNRRNRIIQELSRNDCGEQYRYEARRNSGNWFENSGLGEFFGTSPQPRRRRGDNFSDSIQPYATYRTMCVRLCDGYYFPVSFSTLPSSFSRDSDTCLNKCAAPAELYVYRNPGSEVEQMISPAGEPYDSIKNAWRYRKEYIKGCSCKVTEYSQTDIDAHNNPDKQVNKRADPGENGKQRVILSPQGKPKKSDPTKSAIKNAKTIDDLIR